MGLMCGMRFGPDPARIGTIRIAHFLALPGRYTAETKFVYENQAFA